jgi:hypothetical protein
MNGGAAALGIQVVGVGEDDLELEEATLQLRRELIELDVEGVEARSYGDPGPGVRSVDLIGLGSLVVNVVQSEAFKEVVTAIISWLGRRRQGAVKLEVNGDVLELTGLSSQEQRRVCDEWLRRNAGGERSVPTTAIAPVPPVGSRRALIVANTSYEDPGLRQLRAPMDDAEALARVLGDPRIGDFEVRTMLDEPAHVIHEAVEDFFADCGRDDLLLLHFSGHGIKDEDGELYFAASTTKLRRLAATAVAADFVNRRMSRSRSQRIVLLLDCCYAGAFERSLAPRAGGRLGIEEHFGGRGRAVITASSAMEYAFEGDRLADSRQMAPSVFTSALVDGLATGDADRDQDGHVTLDELYDYVYDRVRATTPSQTPGKWTFAVEGDLYIARRARPVTTPAPLPAELQEAVGNPLVQVRAGAVRELVGLLASRHAGMALAARLALVELAGDDSRTVSTAARAALGAEEHPGPARAVPAPMELSTTAIDFGRLALHSLSPDLTVRVSTPGSSGGVARVTASPSWIKVRPAGDEISIGIETAIAGDHDGEIAVDTDHGQATILVRARVEPAPPTVGARTPRASLTGASPPAQTSPDHPAAPVAAKLPPDTGQARPVTLRIDPLEPTAELRLLLIRGLRVLPLLAFLALSACASLLVAVASWVAILVTGRLPMSLTTRQVQYLRDRTRIYAYAAGLVDRYPPLSSTAALADPGDYAPVTVDFRPGPNDRHRSSILLRWLLVLPFVAAWAALYPVACATALIGWVTLLTTGRWPDGPRRFLLGYLDWSLRTAVYSKLLTDQRPPWALASDRSTP